MGGGHGEVKQAGAGAAVGWLAFGGFGVARLRQRSAEIRRSTALWRRVGWRWCRRCLRHALGLLREGCGGPPVRVGAEHRSEAKPVAARPGWRRLCKADGLKARSAVAWQPTGGTRPKYYLKNFITSLAGIPARIAFVAKVLLAVWLLT